MKGECVESEYKKSLLLLLIVLMTTITIFSTITTAGIPDTDVEKYIRKPINSKNAIPVKVEITRHFNTPGRIAPDSAGKNDSYIWSVGGRCTCGIDRSYKKHGKIVWKNQCNNCGGKSCLSYEQGAYYGFNYGTSPEGLIYCTRCDMDWCKIHGKEHWVPTRAWLSK